jgi:hypothetical protein
MKQIKVEPLLFVFILLILPILIVTIPFVQIWAVNTLFKTSIEYSWLNWACVIILNSSIRIWTYGEK